jgi:hypothetical protein
MIAIFREYFGPMKMLFDALPAERHALVERELQETIERYNRAADGTLCAAMTYVNVIVKNQ